MDFWTSGPGWASVADQQVAAELRGTDARRAGQPGRQSPGYVRRALAAAFVALAMRLDRAATARIAVEHRLA